MQHFPDPINEYLVMPWLELRLLPISDCFQLTKTMKDGATAMSWTGGIPKYPYEYGIYPLKSGAVSHPHLNESGAIVSNDEVKYPAREDKEASNPEILFHIQCLTQATMMRSSLQGEESKNIPILTSQTTALSSFPM
mmetsp:Transcript_2573/g.4780  ORF Transcript_2573/g.4780 Transcript_2573/m.4780 type:complete len:137 (+) Transcript_2573:90-500(+)